MFKKFFRTIYWRILVIFVLGFLVFQLLTFFVTMQSFVDFYYRTERDPLGTVHDMMADAMGGGLFAFGLLVFVFIAGVVDVLGYLAQNRQYSQLGAAITSFANGRYNSRVELRGNPQMENIADAFNSMADIVVKNMDELRATDKLRRELVENVAHDLSGPVTSIQGYVETLMLKGDELDSAEREKFLKVIFANSKFLSNLTTDLRELSKLDSSELQLEEEDFSIQVLASDVASRYQDEAESRGIEVVVKESAEGGPLVQGDIGLIERVLSNLIENSLLYSENGGAVTIHFVVEEEWLVVTVADTGIGIPEEDLPFVCDRFYRVQKSRSKDVGGSGLGLSITRSIISAHGQTMGISSEFGVGTSVRFTLGLA